MSDPRWKTEKLYLTYPNDRAGFHIFDEDDRSLCGKWMMFAKRESECTPIAGSERYVKGQDCKACFRKAGLPTEAA